MTTPATGRQITSACDGVTRTFGCPGFRAAEDLTLYLLNDPNAANEDGTLLVNGTDYVIGGGDSASGQATVTTTIAQPAGKYLRRYRTTSRKQDVEIVASQGVPAATQEGALDRLSLVDEEIADDFEQRSIRGRAGERFPPLPANRAGLALMFGVDQKPTVGALSAYAVIQGIGVAITQINPATIQVSVPSLHNAYDEGAVGDGIANDRAAFVALDAAIANPLQGFRLLPGDYKIGADLTIARDLFIEPGARFVIPNGVTLTLNGYVHAGVHQIFVCIGTGKVVFNWRKTPRGPMEWWGAKADLSIDCLPHWNAAAKALLVIECMGGDYLFSTTPKLTYPNRGVRGIGSPRYVNGNAEVTRFEMGDGSANILQVGPDAQPATINDFQQGNWVSDIYASRNVAPVIGSACKGIRVQFTLYCILERVKSAESMIGFDFYGSVATKAIDCEAVRALAGTGPGADYWRGFHNDGTAVIGAAGGNASLYLVRPNYGCNLPALQVGDSIGIYANGSWTDFFVDQPEGVSCNKDIRLLGNGAVNPAVVDTGNVDCRINHPVSDQFYGVGIEIENLAHTGIVEIDHPYLGPNPGASKSLRVINSKGIVTITAGELIHGNAPNVLPVSIENSSGVQLLGTAVLECGNANPAVKLDAATNCRIEPMIANAVNTGAAAVQLVNACTANRIAPTVKGKASAFTKGIEVVGAADGRNEYNLSGIDSGCINGGANNKLLRNAVQITAVGPTGTSYVSGVVG